MDPQPTLVTQRLVLRPFTPDDAPAVARLCAPREMADTTIALPHPYPEGAAGAWIASHLPGFEKERQAVFAVALPDGGLLGCVSLERWKAHGLAELGFWFGVPHWNRGYCTEAAGAVVGYGFEGLGVRKTHSCCMTMNPASRRVLVKLGFRSEGVRRAHVLKWDEPRDVENFGLLREDWRPGPSPAVRGP